MPGSSSIRESNRQVAIFLDGNRLDDHADPQRDLVWLGAALEQLLNVRMPGIAQKLGAALTTLFGSYTQTQTNWLDRRGRPQTGPWLERWVAEFYDHRSAIHGEPARTSTWQPWEHGLVATAVWTLALKLLLANEGRYDLKSRDEDEANAIDERLATGSPVGARWASASSDAAWNRAHVQAAAHLARLQADSGP